MNILNSFKISVVKKCGSSLQRKVREAIKIGAEYGQLLNKKEEINRCIIPILKADGPPPINVQMEDEVKSNPTMTKLDEETALRKVRERAMKSVNDFRDNQQRESKRIRKDNNP